MNNINVKTELREKVDSVAYGESVIDEIDEMSGDVGASTIQRVNSVTHWKAFVHRHSRLHIHTRIWIQMRRERAQATTKNNKHVQ